MGEWFEVWVPVNVFPNCCPMVPTLVLNASPPSHVVWDVTFFILLKFYYILESIFEFSCNFHLFIYVSVSYYDFWHSKLYLQQLYLPLTDNLFREFLTFLNVHPIPILVSFMYLQKLLFYWNFNINLEIFAIS